MPAPTFAEILKQSIQADYLKKESVEPQENPTWAQGTYFNLKVEEEDEEQKDTE